MAKVEADDPRLLLNKTTKGTRRYNQEGEGSVLGKKFHSPRVHTAPVAYDEGLAERMADCVPPHATQKKMFGGICYLDRGNMACGIVADKLMLRLTKELVAEYRREPHTADMDFTKRPMPSMMYVDAEGIADDDQLRLWVDRAFSFTAGLPSK